MSNEQYHRLFNKVEEKIINNDWKKGEKLPSMTELARTFNVSNSTIREIYRSLETKKYVEIIQGKGTFSIYNSNFKNEYEQRLRDLMAITEFRIITEPSFAKLAAIEAYEHEIKLINQSAIKMEELANVGESTIQEDVDFHRLIVEATHNKYAIQMYNKLQEDLKEMRIYTRKKHMITNAVHYHKMIAQAIENRHPEEAERLMKAHLQSNNELAIHELSL